MHILRPKIPPWIDLLKKTLYPSCSFVLSTLNASSDIIFSSIWTITLVLIDTWSLGWKYISRKLLPDSSSVDSSSIFSSSSYSCSIMTSSSSGSSFRQRESHMKGCCMDRSTPSKRHPIFKAPLFDLSRDIVVKFFIITSSQNFFAT